MAGNPAAAQPGCPAERTPKAMIIAVHGFNDYSNAFESTGGVFQKLPTAIAVYAYDQRGFGGAAASPGIWAGEDNLVSDLAAVRETGFRGAIRA